MTELAQADSPPEVARQTLDLVVREIAACLTETRVALETHAAQADAAQLQAARLQLQQVQGVLRMLEIHGAALLAEEMRQVVAYLEAAGAGIRNQPESLDALMRALAQMPGYLERVLAGGRDLALVLLPLLNDLRAVRGNALLSEGTLLLLNLKSDRQAVVATDDGGDNGLGAAHWARRLRARYQLGLLGWIRGERIEQNLELMAVVVRQLEHVATQQAVFQLWWVLGALLEALRDRGIEAGVSVKRLLGLADRELRRLYEQGEGRYAQQPPIELLNNLLYYVARSASKGPLVTAVRASFRLDELLPVDEDVELERENLSAPSVRMMQTVAAAIREDLGRIKDVLDDFVRRGGNALEQLVPQVQLLRKIGDTLGVLGLGEQRGRVQSEIARIETVMANGSAPDESWLVDVAATLIEIEDHLDDDLIGLILPRQAGPLTASVDLDFQQVQSAVLRECLINLARVKEYVGQYVGGTLDTSGFDNWPELVRGIDAGLAMLDKTRARDVLDRIRAQLTVLMQSAVGFAPAALERLADAIVSFEYYIETLHSGRSDPWYMLDNADLALAAIDVQPQPPRPVAVTGEGHEATQVLTPRTVLEALTDPQSTIVQFEPLVPAVPQPGVALPPLLAVDADLLALYLEEAREEVANIEQLFPAWDRHPEDQDALLNLRRAFHTIKGSGRMVGANDIAQFSWAIESLLNALIDRTVTRSPALLATLRQAVRVLPQFVEHLAGGPRPSAEADVVAAAAQDFAAGRGSEEEFAATQLLPQLGPDEEIDWVIDDGSEPESEQQADLTLRDIYARETDSHVAVVRDYLLRANGASAPHALPETVYRACHTLLGSSRMAEARHGMRLSQPLDSWLRKAYEAGVGLSQQDLQLLAECMAEMERISRHLDEGTQFFDSHESLRGRIEAAALAVDQRSTTPVVQYDREIAAVFSDEASELLEAAQAAMAQLPPSHSGAVPDLSPLKRPLHTLKGGARMAGVSAMGDLAHEMETLVTQVEQGLVPWNDAAHGVMQAAIDELSRMRDLLSAGQPVAGSALPPRSPVPVALPVPVPVPVPEPEPLPVLEPPVFEPVVPAPEVPEPPAPAPGALLPPGRDGVSVADRPELARVDADLLDQLLNNVGEVSIARSRVEQQFELVGNNLGELARTVTRLKQQLRNLELETEAQILHRHQTESADQSGFDPLELDRYSAIQQFSRALSETASDVASIQQLLETQSTDAQDLLQQQGRVVSELQNGLLRTRMVSFQRHVQRLTRIVRQTSADTGKHTEFVVEGASAELDRQLLERMLPPLEHLLRNAVVHGIESPAMRRALGKPEAGRISLSLQREGAEVVLTVADDGAGLDLPAIRTRAVAAGLLAPDRMLPDDDLMQLVLEPGFSTAASVTQWAGRGVGLDVVATEVRKLGGVLQMQTRAGAGSSFAVRLPFTMAVAQALLVRIGDEYYALPLPMVDSVVRLPAGEVARHMGEAAPAYVHGGQRYRLQPLGVFVGLEPAPLPAPEVTVPVALVRAGEHSTGLIIDELLGSREIVLKNVGPQIAAIRGLSGATILGDGRVAIILDIATLLRTEGRQRSGYVVHRPQADHRPVVLVVDDSITVRRVTQRLLERNGMQVLTARDGEDALSLLAEVLPDIVLLDVEMPRMDGYELAQRLRAQPRTQAVPIIMITSRVGAKHRARALELGVNDYLGKPYQEAELLAAIAPLVAAKGSP